MISRRKLFLFVFVLMVVAAFAAAGKVSANGGPHGGFTATTDACAGCHRTHTAKGPGLLIEASTYQLCITCHGSNVTGANTNVLDGKYSNRNANSTMGQPGTAINGDLLGGGFVSYKGVAVTSSHDMIGAGNTVNAWGNGTTARGAASPIDSLSNPNGFNCASCHDPHGSTNYRILKISINGYGVGVGRPDEGALKDYDSENWISGQSSICRACHAAYHQTAVGQGSTANGGSYTHRVDMSYLFTSALITQVNPEAVGYGGQKLPLALTGTSNLVVCQTCHIPHGSSAQMTGFAAGGPTLAGTVPGNTSANDSALLRLDNRAVCEACHQK